MSHHGIKFPDDATMYGKPFKQRVGLTLFNQCLGLQANEAITGVKSTASIFGRGQWAWQTPLGAL